MSIFSNINLFGHNILCITKPRVDFIPQWRQNLKTNYQRKKSKMAIMNVVHINQFKNFASTTENK